MKRIEKTKKIQASQSAVWKAWTTNQGAQEFFAPKTNIELWLGGNYEILFMPNNPPDQRGAEGLKVLSFVPEEMLSFEWNAPPQFPNVRKQRTWVVITLRKIEENQTEVTLRHLGWKDGDEWQSVFDYFQNAWDFVLNNLEKRFTSGPIDWNRN